MASDCEHFRQAQLWASTGPSCCISIKKTSWPCTWSQRCWSASPKFKVVLIVSRQNGGVQATVTRFCPILYRYFFFCSSIGSCQYIYYYYFIIMKMIMLYIRMILSSLWCVLHKLSFHIGEQEGSWRDEASWASEPSFAVLDSRDRLSHA